MRKIEFQATLLSFTFTLISFIGLGQGSGGVRSPYIFNGANISSGLNDLSQIYQEMAKYYEGVEKANPALLQEVFHDSWLMRDTDNDGRPLLHVESKEEFVSRVRNHGPYQDYAADRTFSNIAFAGDQIALVRVTKSGATNFFLFKLNGKWTLTDKIWAMPVDSDEESDPYREVEHLVRRYLQSLSVGNVADVKDILESKWDVKSISEDGKLLIKTRAEWLNELAKTKMDFPETNLMSIDVFENSLAIVRLDEPKKSTIRFITAFKIDGKWSIVSECLAQNPSEV